MKRIGIISDTHSPERAKLCQAFCQFGRANVTSVPYLVARLKVV